MQLTFEFKVDVRSIRFCTFLLGFDTFFYHAVLYENFYPLGYIRGTLQYTKYRLHLVLRLRGGKKIKKKTYTTS